LNSIVSAIRSLGLSSLRARLNAADLSCLSAWSASRILLSRFFAGGLTLAKRCPTLPQA